MRKMDDLHLAYFIELRLKSKHDFDAANDVALSAGLRDYKRKFVLIQPGDWPCQFYCRQIIYGCLKKFTRHNPDCGDFPTDSNMVVSHNHSSYSFPSTTAYTVYGAVSTPKIKVELDDAMVDLFNKLLCLQDTMVWPCNEILQLENTILRLLDAILRHNDTIVRLLDTILWHNNMIVRVSNIRSLNVCMTRR